MALRKEGSGVVLDCQLPHLIGIDKDLLRTGIILYYLKVNTAFSLNILNAFLFFLEILNSQSFQLLLFITLNVKK